MYLCVNRKSIRKDCLKDSTKLFKSVLLNFSNLYSSSYLVLSFVAFPFRCTQLVHYFCLFHWISEHFTDNGNNRLVYLWQVPIVFPDVSLTSVHVHVTIEWLYETRHRIFQHLRWHLRFYLCRPL